MKEEKIFLIYYGDPEDSDISLGYIKGTEEDADKFCNEYNANCKSRWNKAWWEELKELPKTIGHWIDVGDSLFACSLCDNEIESKYKALLPMICPYCGTVMPPKQ